MRSHDRFQYGAAFRKASWDGHPGKTRCKLLQNCIDDTRPFALLQFSMRSHALFIEQGRSVMSADHSGHTIFAAFVHAMLAALRALAMSLVANLSTLTSAP